jgi:Ca2+-binding EF-hand superfamily protein
VACVNDQADVQDSLLFTLDKDQDGFLSLKEAAGHHTLLDNFKLIDVNEDGYLSLEELIASNINKQ